MKYANRSLTYSLILLLLILSSCKNPPVKQTSEILPRSVPENEGVTSESIINFLQGIEKSSHEFHSFMYLRHGKVIAEGWWDPYKPDLKHTLYSTSKSFTSTAVGFAVNENRIKVTDKVISFFPEYLPDTVSMYLADMEIRDLLSMSAGMVPDPTFKVVANDTNWVKGFLSQKVVNDPGTKFLYNSLATYMLSAIVQKATGEKVINYLTPRLFSPLGISGPDWETDLSGINSGGWGLRLKTEDMAKFGQLYLQKGNWNGKQILPESWIAEATTFKIDQMPGVQQSVRDSSDWLQGYCYQFWRCRNNAFRGDGAFGQYIIVMPEKDAVVAITSETQDMQNEINLVWKFLLPGLKDEKLPENPHGNKTLQEMLSNLKLPATVSDIDSPFKNRISGKTFGLNPNEMKLESLKFYFTGEICNVTMKTDNNEFIFSFGHGIWTKGETTRRGPNLLLKAKGHFDGMPAVKVACSYHWMDKNTLELDLRYIESPHTERITCSFDENKIKAEIKYSFVPEVIQAQLAGELIN